MINFNFIVALIATNLICLSYGDSIAAFDQRRSHYIDRSLDAANPGFGDIVLMAFRDIEIDSTHLAARLYNAITDEPYKADFFLQNAVRVLYLTDREGSSYNYSAQIKAVIAELAPFWQHDDVMNQDILKDQYYWTENHMVLWDSAAFLLKQKWPELDFDANLENRLRNFLNIKIENGYYQFLSAVFFPYTMSALLNLADFSENDEIKELAIDALEVLLLDVMKSVNSVGRFYPAQGRSKESRFEDVGLSNDIKCIFLLTGKGDIPISQSASSVHLATTDSDNLINIINTFSPIISDETYYGNTIAQFKDDSFYLDSELYPISDYDKTTFQLSAGAYWIHEENIWNDTNNLAIGLNLQSHPQFAPFFAGGIFQADWFISLFDFGLRGSLLTDITVNLWKHGPSMLSSMQHFNPGTSGQDQFPFGATSGKLGVYAQSGNSSEGGFVNTVLPDIVQNNNVALMVYDSSTIENVLSVVNDTYGLDLAAAFGIYNYNVHWFIPLDKYTETDEYENWILARERENAHEGYIAIRRDGACINPVVNRYITCDSQRSVYVVIVGNKDTHQNFNQFTLMVQDSTFTDTDTSTSITIDGQTLTL